MEASHLLVFAEVSELGPEAWIAQVLQGVKLILGIQILAIDAGTWAECMKSESAALLMGHSKLTFLLEK